MFATYLRRELTNRKKQSVIIAIGMALAIGLVIIVNAVSAGVQSAQASVLESVYGVGTDITVTQASEPGEGGGPGQFDFGADAGETTDGSTTIDQTQLTVVRGSASYEDTALTTVAGVDNVAASTGTLSLQSTTFSGEMPDFSQMQEGGPGEAPPTGGSDGEGGSSFGIESFTVTGIDIAGEAVGPLTAVTVTDGRTFTDADTEANVTVLDANYAETNEIAVGDAIDIGGTDFEVIGLVSSTSSEATTAANAYISLPIAQSLADLDGQLTDIYVQAESSADIAQIQSDIETALPDATVSSQADLASSVSGSLSTASSLVSSLGTWLSVIVLGAAFLIATLFTISGVGRRTREFGTLKAIGWRNGMIVRQVAGESLVQGLIGGMIGIAIGLGGIWVINLIGITLSGATGGTSFAFQGGQAPTDAEMPTDTTGGGFGGGGGQFADAAASTVDIVLHAPVTISVILIAVGLAVLGGLIAGSFGGWRAARLRPAESLRSVA